MSIIIQQLSKYKAFVNYHRTDDLKPNTVPNHTTIYVQALWIAEEHENFSGEWLFMPLNNNLEWHEKYTYWLPQRDLSILSKV